MYGLRVPRKGIGSRFHVGSQVPGHGSQVEGPRSRLWVRGHRWRVSGPGSHVWVAVSNFRVPATTFPIFLKFQACSFIKKRLWHRCFPVNIVQAFRTHVSIEHLWWQLLNINIFFSEVYVPNIYSPFNDEVQLNICKF